MTGQFENENDTNFLELFIFYSDCLVMIEEI